MRPTPLNFLCLPPADAWPSAYLRGGQLKQLFEVAPGAARFATRLSFDTNLRDSVVILTKSSLHALPETALAELKSRGNFLVADFVDAKVRLELVPHCSALLASSRRQYQYLLSLRTCPVFHVTHHVDLRIPKSQPAVDAPRIAYFGNLANTISSFRIRRKVDFFDATRSDSLGWVDMLPRYPIHYAVRRQQPFDGFKPFLKGFLAAHVGAVIMTLDDEESRCHLGADYPYYVAGTDPQDIGAAIRTVRKTYGGPVWRQARIAMHELAERTKRQVVIDEIERFLSFLVSQGR